jgi:hypothetical protein
VERPLWQIVLAILMAGAAVHRAAASAMLFLGADGSLLWLAMALEASGLAIAAIGLWIGGHAALFGAAMLGIGLCGSALALGAAGGAAMVPIAFGRLFVGILGAAGLAFVVRKELVPSTQGASR